ncbi:MAG: hypothetical protein HYZ74_08640, partial [Elusimicrobia bacterium]|nr:hypothetical protein [Elusimicrobiota bacterium]
MPRPSAAPIPTAPAPELRALKGLSQENHAKLAFKMKDIAAALTESSVHETPLTDAATLAAPRRSLSALEITPRKSKAPGFSKKILGQRLEAVPRLKKTLLRMMEDPDIPGSFKRTVKRALEDEEATVLVLSKKIMGKYAIPKHTGGMHLFLPGPG